MSAPHRHHDACGCAPAAPAGPACGCASCEGTLDEARVGARLRLALAGGALLAAGRALSLWINPFSGGAIELLACALMAVPILSDAWAGLRRGQVGFPSLVALAFLACLASGSYGTAGLVAFLMIMAGQLENRTAIGARQAIETLVRATPDTAHRREPDGRVLDRPARELAPGDLIEVRPGEVLPIDGRVEEGEGSVDESSITGEGAPVDKAPGAAVYAGTSNLTGVLAVRVERVGEDTTVGRVKRLILSAAGSKLPLMGVMERNAGWYTPLVVMVALATWYFQRDQDGSLERAIAVLIMACPCSLILAAPSVMIAAITAAARAGVLVKNAVELESFHRVEHVFFDKTGTLTTGEMTVQRMSPAPGVEAAVVLAQAGGLAGASNHPSAKAVRRAMERARVPAAAVREVREHHGRGLSGTLDGLAVFLGRPEWVAAQLGIAPPPGDPAATRLSYGRAGEGILAGFTLDDHLREEAAASVRDLRACGVRRFTLLTGDAWDAARKVGEAAGFDEIQAKCLPEDKLARLNEVKARGVVTAVVGDGINDAPVLAAGHVGIAMGALGSQVAVESASIALMSPSLDRLPFLHRLSARAKLLIWANIAVGLLVIAAGLLGVLLGVLSPVLAAVLHNASALVILFNSARLVNMRPAS